MRKMTKATLYKSGAIAIEHEGTIYESLQTWRLALAEHGECVLQGLRPRTDPYGRGTRTHQHSDLWLQANGDFGIHGDQFYVLGRVEIPR